jgi:hypothetical protein
MILAPVVAAENTNVVAESDLPRGDGGATLDVGKIDVSIRSTEGWQKKSWTPETKRLRERTRPPACQISRG